MIEEEIQPESAANSGDFDPALPDSSDAAASGSEVARWLKEHGDVVWYFALGRTRSQEAAEEVVQETFLAALQARGTFAGDSSERTWLLGIASHKVADHFRRIRRASGVSGAAGALGAADGLSEDAVSEASAFSTMFTEKGMWAQPPARWGLDASKAAEEAEMLAALRGCVELLPRSMGEAVWLRDLMALPADEVCKAMGITATNLWSRMHRARAALRACVERSMVGTRKGAK